MTNAPTFDWHMTNLRNYVNLTATNVPPTISAASSWRSSARARACAACRATSRRHRALCAQSLFHNRPCRSDTAAQAVLQAFHILNNFDIPLRRGARSG